MPIRDTPHLLDNADTNIGNAVDAFPTSNSIITIPNQNPDRILNLNADDSKTGQMASVVVTATNLPNLLIQPAPSTAFGITSFAGPLVAIFEYGNGSTFTAVEVDVAISNVASFNTTSGLKDGGIVVSLPAGTLRVYGRNDGNLITPSNMFKVDPINGTIQSIPAANVFGTAAQGNIPRNVGSWSNSTNPAPPGAHMKAAAVYFSHPSPSTGMKNTKTLWIWNGGPSVAGQITTQVQTSFDGTGPALYWVPQLAKSVQLHRLPLSTAFTITLIDQFGFVDSIAVAGGANSPIIQLPATISQIGVQGADGNTVSCALVFEIGI
jgi:hypothetical protein